MMRHATFGCVHSKESGAPMGSTVNLYFVASPLQYLAARAIARQVDQGNRQVLVWYKRGVTPVVTAEEWDASWHMPWPRFHPLPGRFGVRRRLLENIARVSELVGQCDTLLIHSAVFDTEAINYFLRALPATCGAKEMHARILPDGIISIRRYPLSLLKRGLQRLRRLRRLMDPRLDYCCFKGDRIGSDASFCDRIYIIPNLPHEYPADRVFPLPPLVSASAPSATSSRKTALVIGQPLVGAGLLRGDDLPGLTEEIFRWLTAESFDAIDYKGHPKDPNLELCRNGYNVLELREPLESWMARSHYHAVVGVRSSALLFARQLYAAETRVIAFGWDRVRFKSKSEERDMRNAFVACGIQLR
jgi:hypothetical protein